MNYRELNLRCALLADIAKLKLPSKAIAERLLLKAHYVPAATVCEEALNAIRTDEGSADKEKTAAIESKLKEEAPVTDRRFTAEAFEQIVDAAMAESKKDENGNDAIASCLTDEDEPIPLYDWLELVAYALGKAR